MYASVNEPIRYLKLVYGNCLSKSILLDASVTFSYAVKTSKYFIIAHITTIILFGKKN